LLAAALHGEKARPVLVQSIAAQSVTANTLVAFMIASLIAMHRPMQHTLFLTAFFTHRVE
jgi:hypothetical protein